MQQGIRHAQTSGATSPQKWICSMARNTSSRDGVLVYVLIPHSPSREFPASVANRVPPWRLGHRSAKCKNEEMNHVITRINTRSWWPVENVWYLTSSQLHRVPTITPAQTNGCAAYTRVLAARKCIVDEHTKIKNPRSVNLYPTHAARDPWFELGSRDYQHTRRTIERHEKGIFIRDTFPKYVVFFHNFHFPPKH